MTKDEIKDKCFNVSILDSGRDGDTGCYRLYHDLLGEFEIGNCHFKSIPQSGVNILLNGSCTLSLNEEECIFIAELTINSDDSNKGVVLFRC